MVRQAGNYRWSSLAAHGDGKPDELLEHVRDFPDFRGDFRGQTLFSVFVRGKERGERVAAVLEPVLPADPISLVGAI